jgi:hypothetical protein
MRFTPTFAALFASVLATTVAANSIPQKVVFSATGISDVTAKPDGCATVSPAGVSQTACVKHVFTNGFTMSVRGIPNTNEIFCAISGTSGTCGPNNVEATVDLTGGTGDAPPPSGASGTTSLSAADKSSNPISSSSSSSNSSSSSKSSNNNSNSSSSNSSKSSNNSSSNINSSNNSSNSTSNSNNSSNGNNDSGNNNGKNDSGNNNGNNENSNNNGNNENSNNNGNNNNNNNNNNGKDVKVVKETIKKTVIIKESSKGNKNNNKKNSKKSSKKSSSKKSSGQSISQKVTFSSGSSSVTAKPDGCASITANGVKQTACVKHVFTNGFTMSVRGIPNTDELFCAVSGTTGTCGPDNVKAVVDLTGGTGNAPAATNPAGSPKSDFSAADISSAPISRRHARDFLRN